MITIEEIVDFTKDFLKEDNIFPDTDIFSLGIYGDDMEYSKWNEYLIKVACSIFAISPEEVGFAGTNSSANTVFESNNESRLKHSQDKGLYPILKFLQSRVNRYIIDKIDPEYCLRYVGYDAMSRAEEVDIVIKKSSSLITLDEAREELGYKALKQKGVSDKVMSSTYAQFEMMQSQQGMLGGEGVDGQDNQGGVDGDYNTGEGDLTEQDNPFKD
jgi:hypothetical protein